MDRFIGICYDKFNLSIIYLKSNMDRFIVIDTISYILEDMNLKSNMDRFIGIENLKDWLKKNVFKIQYG